METMIHNSRITSGTYHPETTHKLNGVIPARCELRVILITKTGQPKKYRLTIWNRKSPAINTAFSIYNALSKTNRISCRARMILLNNCKLVFTAVDSIVLMPTR